MKLDREMSSANFYCDLTVGMALPLVWLDHVRKKICFLAEEITGCTTEAAKGTNKAARNTPSCFLFLALFLQ